MKKFRFLACLGWLVVLAPTAWAARPLALVYQGPGACKDEDSDCAQSAAEVARLAGFQVKFVGPKALTRKSTSAQVEALFANARVWVQPGGDATEASQEMSETLTEGLKVFIKSGGGYVGFCAGGFMATEFISRNGGIGLGIVPGFNRAYHGGFALEPVIWQGKLRQIYFEGGPYFYGFEQSPGVEVTATYETGAAASIRTFFGKGRVWVTGLHPEAPLRWTTDDEIVDPDGIEQNLAAEMIRWAGNKSGVKKPSRRKVAKFSGNH